MDGTDSQAREHMDGKGQPRHEASSALFAGRYLFKVAGRTKGVCWSMCRGWRSLGERQQIASRAFVSL